MKFSKIDSNCSVVIQRYFSNRNKIIFLVFEHHMKLYDAVQDVVIGEIDLPQKCSLMINENIIAINPRTDSNPENKKPIIYIIQDELHIPINEKCRSCYLF